MKEKWKGSALLTPLPAVLVGCGSGDSPNLITVAWTGILCSHPPKTYISLRKERYSYDIIKKNGVFTINIPSSDLVKSVDFCGVKSGREVNKFEQCALSFQKCFEIDTISVNECPISLECKVSDIIPLGSHDMFLADIVAVDVDDSVLVNGRLDVDKCKPFAYSHGEYYKLGKKLGSFGYSVMKKSTKRKRAKCAQGEKK